jgi:MFS superfamily sulfate permease-like transporter
VKFLIHLWNYLPLRSLFLGDIDVEPIPENKTIVRVRYAAVFSNWLSIKAKIDRIPANQEVIIDLSETNLIDHTVMEKLHEMEHDFELNGRKLSVVGMQDHQSYSQHPYAARKKGANVSKTGSNGTSSHGAMPTIVPPPVVNGHVEKPAGSPGEPVAH